MAKRVAKFEKVSFEQFEKDWRDTFEMKDDESWSEGDSYTQKEIKEIYDSILLPTRSTKFSAGYDFKSPLTILLEPGESIKIPTGIRCYIEDGYFLSLYPRSSLGFKFQMALANTVGIIDADYYNSSNEGHIICGIVNHGERIISIRKGDRFCQGIFLPYLLAEEDEVLGKRDGGFGSSGS